MPLTEITRPDYDGRFLRYASDTPHLECHFLYSGNGLPMGDVAKRFSTLHSCTILFLSIARLWTAGCHQ